MNTSFCLFPLFIDLIVTNLNGPFQFRPVSCVAADGLSRSRIVIVSRFSTFTSIFNFVSSLRCVSKIYVLSTINFAIITRNSVQISAMNKDIFTCSISNTYSRQHWRIIYPFQTHGLVCFASIDLVFPVDKISWTIMMDRRY